MKTISCFICMSVLFAACNNHMKQLPVENDDTAFLKKGGIDFFYLGKRFGFGDDTLHVTYTYLFDTSYDYNTNLSKGFIDTFSIQNTFYRIRIYNYDSCLVEKYIEQRWMQDLFFVRNQWNQNRIVKDINLDGYPDLAIEWRFQVEVHLYNPISKAFSKESHFSLTKDVTTADSTKKLFYDLRTAKIFEGGRLYNLQNDTPYVYYRFIVDYYPNDENFTDSIHAVKLYRCKNGNEDDTVFMKQLNPKDFIWYDSISFWRKNWKRLIKEY
ncbi:hypothetical protein ACI6Q2_10295 [Chitinophagaceae bacterium LWZ2-11]